MTGVVFDLRQHLALGGAEDQFVGVEDGQHAGERAVALHAEIAGVVDADKIDAAALDELRGEAVASAGHDQAAAGRDLAAQAIEAGLPRNSATPSVSSPSALACMRPISVMAASVAKAGSLISRSRSTMRTCAGSAGAERVDERRVGLRIGECLALVA